MLLAFKDEHNAIIKENVELKKKVEELETRIREMVCKWCDSTKHSSEKCRNHELIGNSMRLQLGTGIFCIACSKSAQQLWVVVIPKDSYACLVGKWHPNIITGCTIEALNFRCGLDYAGDSTLEKFEFLTKHEYQVIKEREPKIAKWLVEHQAWTE